MKKILLFVFCMLLGFYWISFVNWEAFSIKKYDIVWNFEEDWTINITESLDVNFTENRHWIIRKIPKTYEVQKSMFRIFINNIKVIWDNYSLTKTSDKIELKIWDANKTIIWDKNYNISYSVYWLVRKFSWYQELYQNIIWLQWDTTINNVNFELNFPKDITSLKKDDIFIYYWKYWETLTWNIVYKIIWKKIIWHIQHLDSNEWLTIWMRLWSGFFLLEDDKQKRLINTYSDSVLWDYDVFSPKFNIITLVFVLIYLVYFFFLFRWPHKRLQWKKYRKELVVVEYDPPKWLSASECWVLIDNKVDWIDITTLIYEFAIKWYIQIKAEKEWNWIFKHQTYSILKKVDKISDSEPEYKKYFFDELFEDSDEFIFTSKNYTFWTIVSKTIEKLKKVSKKWYLDWRIRTTWSFKLTYFLVFFWTSILVDFFVISMIALSSEYNKVHIFVIPFIFVLNIVLFLNTFFIWREEVLTVEWKKIQNHLFWYKDFLEHVEEDKLKTFLEQDPLFFDKVLPYAVVFGLWTKFIKKITPLLKESPKRYDWDFNTMAFVHSFDTISSYSTATYSSSSWFSSGSSFSWWWFSGWWWWGWWWSSR